MKSFRVRSRDGRVDLQAVLRELGKREILHVMIEAGAELNGAALESRDCGQDGPLLRAEDHGERRGADGADVAARVCENRPALQHLTVNHCGSDFVVQGYFHDVYGNHGTRRKD